MDQKLIISIALFAATTCSSIADDSQSGNSVGAPVLVTKPEKALVNFVPVVTRTMRGDVRADWLASMREKLPMSQRQVGPFGLAQNPDEKVDVKKAKSPSSTAFLNAIKVMPINFVDAIDGRFAVGAREFRKGQIFPLERGGQKFSTQVVLVKTSYIVFKDVNNGEHVKRNLEILPEGMTRNGKLDAIKGVEATNPDKEQPLKLP